MATPIPPPDPRALPPLRVDRPLPVRRYVPGLGPHPRHLSQDHPDDDAATALQRGLDLLAHRFPWEAHESLERAWLCWRDSDPARAALCTGLIKVAAAWLRTHAGHRRAAERLVDRARSDLSTAAQITGWDFSALLTLTEAFAAGGPWPEAREWISACEVPRGR